MHYSVEGEKIPTRKITGKRKGKGGLGWKGLVEGGHTETVRATFVVLCDYGILTNPHPPPLKGLLGVVSTVVAPAYKLT